MIVAVDPGKTLGCIEVRDRTSLMRGTIYGCYEAACEWPIPGDAARWFDATTLIIEVPEPMGMASFAALRDLLATAEQVGRLLQAHPWARPIRLTRREVKRTLLGRVTGNDRDIRAALEKRFGSGCFALGRKGRGKAKVGAVAPGNLSHVRGHAVAALALAVAAAERGLLA